MGSPAGQASTAEHARPAQATGAAEDDLFEANPWYEWGPYVSERAWGTVREDYSDSGDAWGFFPHDHARSRAYRWNEDGMAGLSDVHHDLCLGLALGPVWFPVNYLVIRALLQYDQFFGPEFTIEYPTRSGQQFTLREVAGDLADRLVSIWVPGTDGRRPVYGGVDKLQSDPAWKDNLLFYEYFRGDSGAGLGAMHQTGWTALVADLILDPPRPSRRMIFRNGHDGSTSSGMEERHDGTA